MNHKPPTAGAASAVERQWLLLQSLPRAPESIDAIALVQLLTDRGIQTTARTVQRDLTALSARLPIRCDDSRKPYAWSWDSQAMQFALPGLSPLQAGVLLSAQAQLRQMLPSNLLEVLAPMFEQARSSLHSGRTDSASAQPSILVSPSTQPRIAPSIAADVLVAVHQALASGRQLRTHYRSHSGEDSHEICLHPCVLVQQGPLHYLAATRTDASSPVLFALHRMSQAQCTDMPAQAASQAQLDAIERLVNGDVSASGTIQIVMHLRHALARPLDEAPLSHDQQRLTLDEDWSCITATVRHTAQLRAWLLGMGADVRVKHPPELVQALHEQRLAVKT